MSYQEKKTLVNMISSVLIFSIYSIYVYSKYTAGGDELAFDLHFWAKAFLILIPVSIVARIIIAILFVIIYKITTMEDIPNFEDERDKLIELKALRSSNWVFIVGFFLAMVSQVMDMTPATMFVIIAVFGLLSEMVDNISRLYFYKKGI